MKYLVTIWHPVLNAWARKVLTKKQKKTYTHLRIGLFLWQAVHSAEQGWRVEWRVEWSGVEGARGAVRGFTPSGVSSVLGTLHTCSVQCPVSCLLVFVTVSQCSDFILERSESPS